MEKKHKLPHLTQEGLTLREERFCREYFENEGNATEAYIQAYQVKKKAKWVTENASRLLAKPHIQKRLQMLITKSEDATALTLERVLREAGEIMERAMSAGEYGPAGAMAKLRAQLTGHLIERKEVKHRTERDMTPEELRKVAEEAAREAGFSFAPLTEAPKDKPTLQ